MKLLVSSLLAVVLVAVNAPVAHAQADILASATRLASIVEVAQEGATIRRMRSRAIAGLGVGLVAAGAALFLAPPKCGLDGGGITTDPLGATYSYSEFIRGRVCDVEVEVRRSGLWLATEENPFFPVLFVRAGTHREYVSEIEAGRGIYVLPEEIEGIRATESHTLRYAGLAMAGAGGALLWYGLSRIDVPFRVDLTRGGGVRASRSFGW